MLLVPDSGVKPSVSSHQSFSGKAGEEDAVGTYRFKGLYLQRIEYPVEYLAGKRFLQPKSEGCMIPPVYLI